MAVGFRLAFGYSHVVNDLATEHFDIASWKVGLQQTSFRSPEASTRTLRVDREISCFAGACFPWGNHSSMTAIATTKISND